MVIIITIITVTILSIPSITNTADSAGIESQSTANKANAASTHDKDGHKSKKHHHHQKCKDDPKDAKKHKVASFGVLVCNNKTISAVYCPNGKLPHPGGKHKVPLESYTASNNVPEMQSSNTHSRSLAYMDVITMDPPCPKPVKKDIDNTLKQLTCSDREMIQHHFNLGFYSSAVQAIDRHNTDGDCDKDGHWHDKCTSVGIFCGSNIFGCNTIDDAIYYCGAIGDKPQKKALCPPGGCISENGTAKCRQNDCQCTGSGQYDHGALYYCKCARKDPIFLEKCESGECIKGSNRCLEKPTTTTSDTIPTPTPNPDPCDCQTDGPICSETFPKECKLKNGWIYKCKPGKKPEPLVECKSGSCQPNSTVCDKDECACTTDQVENGIICGGDFPAKCKLKSGSLYICTEEDKEPEFIKECESGSCTEGSGKCDPGPCDCQMIGKICGSTFPEKCNLSGSALYECHEIGQPPKISTECKSGSCPSGGDACDPDPCVCRDPGLICGSTFPGKCGLDPTALYDCDSTGSNPEKNKDCPSGICESGANECTPVDPCACKDAGQICGSSFEDSCGYDPNSLYYCKDEGDKPVVIEECSSNSCPANSTACEPDPCLCSTSGQVCGSSFPPFCKLEGSSLYFCKKPGDKPSFIQSCPSNVCPVNATECEPEPINCKCESAGKICGSSFDPSCGLDPDTLYVCKGKGENPVEETDCKAGTCLPGGETCEPRYDCTCPDKGIFCGDVFPPECKLNNDTSYQCGEKGDIPVPFKEYPPGECKTTKDPCKCDGTGTVCGSVLENEECKTIDINPNAIYDCKDGMLPVEVEECVDPEFCVPQSTGASCERDPCACDKEGATICGDVLSEACGLETGSSYVCTKGKWTLDEECSHGCSKTEGKCIDKCACTEDGMICGSVLPDCNLDPQTLYKCETGKLPNMIRNCQPGKCEVNATHPFHDDCGPNPCYCKPGETTVCDNKFPELCGFPNNTILVCPDGGGMPKPLKPCDPTECEVVDGSAHCAENPCDCKEIGSFCGSHFEESCRYPPNSVFSCSEAGKPPVSAGSCDPTECVSDGNTATCTEDPCACKVDNTTVCASDFPATCGLAPDMVYSCVNKGAKPVPVEKCDPEKCTSVDGVGKCDKNPCICGSDFLDSCGYDSTAIYKCSGPLAKPELIEECEEGLHCAYEEEGATCHSDLCHCQAEDIGKQVCGSTLFTHCEYEKDVIYTCQKEGEEWQPLRDCAPGTCTALNSTNAKCSLDDCLCKPEDDGKQLCGSNFPDMCKLESNSLYTCTANKPPVKDKACDPSKCVFNPQNGTASCQLDKCVCRAGTNTVCGSSWDPSCQYEPNTIYKCDGEGSKPVVDKDCKPHECVSLDSKTAICKVDPCKCTGNKETLCGHNFLDECKYDPQTIYQCSGEGSTPEEMEKCDNECYHSHTTNQTMCVNGPCDCPQITEPTDFCGSAFPDCEYDDNSVYHCEESGRPPVLKEECTKEGKECVTEGDNSGTCQEDCNCSDGKVKQCGSEFPSRCNLSSTSVYSCEDPKNPVEIEKCTTECVPQPEAHCKVDPCACKDGVAMMCGSEFPASCGYEPEAVYTCSDPKKPTLDQACAPTKCVKLPEPHCFVDPCACKEGSAGICGSMFPAECMFDNNTMYKCDGGRDPVFVQDCEPGECTIEDGLAVCKNDDCLCPEGLKTACGSFFPPECGYTQDIKQILRCTGTGSKPTTGTTCTTECQVLIPGVSARCKPDPCACTSDMVGNKVCASQFPKECKYSDDAVYYCGAVNERPVEIEECKDPSVCEVTLDKGECITPLDPCNCPPGKETVCGSSFNETCGLKDKTVYNCKDRENQPPLPVEECDPFACLTIDNTAACEPDPCLCKGATGAFCGSTYLPECKLDNDTLYTCREAGKYPEVLSECEGGTCDPKTSSCKIDPCNCQSVGEICGSDFDSTCGYNKDAVYNCASVGSKPTLTEECDYGCVKGSGQCTPPPPDPCKCTQAELICGSAFEPQCGLDGDTLYECTGEGVDPVPKEKCIPGGCVAGTTACVPDPCKCGDAASTCGSDYLDSCGFDKDTIYTCTEEGATPQPGQKCGTGLCASVDGTAICKPDCTCKSTKDTCGVDFPSGCNLDKDTLYTCSKVGAKPVPKEVCKDSCKAGTHECYVDPCACQKIGDLCGKDICPEFPPDTVFTCTEIGVKPKVGAACDGTTCNGGKCDPKECVCTEDGPFCGGDINCPGLNKDLYYSCSKGKKPFPFAKCNQGRPMDKRCLCNDIYGMCSTYFPFECGYDQNQVMGCPGGAGTKPVTRQQCGVGRCAAQKCDLNCKCLGTAAMCGKQFDPSCNLDPGTIYSCSNAGATPVPGKSCGRGDLCHTSGGVGRCLAECVCKDVDTVCGAAYPESCGFNPSSVYRCDSVGATPTGARTCTIPCNPQNGPDKCGQYE
ncbi:hypothetical protein BGX31_006705 [Mortierella sp. GBA43]|nr:hypothetical protein BGX31_006705 [Mortierella sp. GBA43]